MKFGSTSPVLLGRNMLRPRMLVVVLVVLAVVEVGWALQCTSSPCQNGGTCRSGNCQCVAGFTGITCQTNINDCTSDSCTSGNVCVDGLNSYVCICAAGTTGSNCQTNLCASNPCSNGGTCLGVLGGNYTCVCPYGTSGRTCTSTLCSSSPCANGGSCSISLQSAPFIIPSRAYQSGTYLSGGTSSSYSFQRAYQAGQMCGSLSSINLFVTSFSQVNTNTYVGEFATTPPTSADGKGLYYTSDGSSSIPSFGATNLIYSPTGFTGASGSYSLTATLPTPLTMTSSSTYSIYYGLGYPNEDGKWAGVINLGGVTPCTSPKSLCTCDSGFTGVQCQSDIKECASSPCSNGGSCRNNVNSYVCTCSAGFTGISCQTDIDECSSSPCSNGASCSNLPAKFLCTCQAGFTGLSCSLIDVCLSSPCVNGAMCIQQNNSNQYSCSCPLGFTGSLCQSDINECTSLPCSNGGSCTQTLGSYSCFCPAAFTGTQCQSDVNECASSPCANGGTCGQTDISGLGVTDLFRCICTAGFTGLRCESDINECASSPCSNGGSCTQPISIKRLACSCLAGFTGLLCQTDINECSSSPCRNGGSCNQSSKPNVFQCVCVTGFTGLQCESDINECASSPCSNGGNCTQAKSANLFVCSCPAGFTGVLCQSDVNECSSSPCSNGGSCSQSNSPNLFSCRCPNGFTGTRCQTDINECASSPCTNNAICIQSLPGSGFTCSCVAGTTGVLCQSDIDECASSPCTNGGSCDHGSQLNSFHCNCPLGFEGFTCDGTIDYCSSQPCSNGGTCQTLFNSFNCHCTTGFTGTICQSDINECTSSPCSNGGFCSASGGVNQFVCTCSAGFTGAVCQTDLNECSSSPCSNGGSCSHSNSPNLFICNCAAGFTGVLCETDLDECISSPCSNGGVCSQSNSPNLFVCACSAGFTGVLCHSDVEECASSPCANGASCSQVSSPYFFVCSCIAGTTGVLCQSDVDECASSPCMNGASCNQQQRLDDFACICAAGFTGILCESDIDECVSSPCSNGGSCSTSSAGANRFLCSCPAGFTGALCQSDVDECASSPCGNGGGCSQASTPNYFMCSCPSGFTGVICESDIDECSSSPCSNGGACTQSNSPDLFICNCAAGFTGVLCESDIDECASSPCSNGGSYSQSNSANLFTCTCSTGFTGLRCQSDIDECSSSPCLNGGTCTQSNSPNLFLCNCAAGFTGPLCQSDINECSCSPCTNGGTCSQSNSPNLFICNCGAGFTGVLCESDIDECTSSPCSNGGSCSQSNLPNLFTCSCGVGFTGVLCQSDVNECSSSPCANDGTCSQGSSANLWACNCVLGFVGVRCQTDVNECVSNPCVNGGTCVNLINNWVCQCPARYTHTTCDFDLLPCLSNPCQNGGTCVGDPLGSYICTCLPSFNGTLCEYNRCQCPNDRYIANTQQCRSGLADVQCQQCTCTQGAYISATPCLSVNLPTYNSVTCTNCTCNLGTTYQSSIFTAGCTGTTKANTPTCLPCHPCGVGSMTSVACGTYNDAICAVGNGNRLTRSTGVFIITSANGLAVATINTAYLIPINANILISQTDKSIFSGFSSFIAANGSLAVSPSYTFLPHDTNLFSTCQTITIQYNTSAILPGFIPAIIRASNELANDWAFIRSSFNSSGASTCVLGFSVFIVTQQPSNVENLPSTGTGSSAAVAAAAGAAIGVITLLVIIITVVFVVLKRRKNQKHLQRIKSQAFDRDVELYRRRSHMQETFAVDLSPGSKPRALNFAGQHEPPEESEIAESDDVRTVGTNQTTTLEKADPAFYLAVQLTTTQEAMNLDHLRELYGVTDEEYARRSNFYPFAERSSTINPEYINADGMDDFDVQDSSLTGSARGYVNADSHPEGVALAYEKTIHPAKPEPEQYQALSKPARVVQRPAHGTRNQDIVDAHDDYETYEQKLKAGESIYQTFRRSKHGKHAANPFRSSAMDEDFSTYVSIKARETEAPPHQSDIGLRDKIYRREYLHFVEKLGKGEFGVVLKAETTDGGRGTARFVAVKTLKDNAVQKEKDDFLSEAKLLASFKHDNVLGLIGICMPEEPWLIIVEYCPHGDLRNFLRLCITCEGLNVTYVEQIHIALQIASGMEYLSNLNFVHRDLAARNCLVGQNSVIKVADFGLSRQLGNDDYYSVKTKGKMPVRWMALESLEFRKFSTKTDVWGFGVVLWEIMTFGTLSPYKAVPLHDLAFQLREGKRLSKPRGCPVEMYETMTKCWHIDAKQRPSFSELRETLFERQHEQLKKGGNLRMLGNELEELTSSTF